MNSKASPKMTLGVLACVSYVAVALAMLLAVAVRYADFASARQVLAIEGWTAHASWQQALESAYSSSTLWNGGYWQSHQNDDDDLFHGKYASLRSTLDYTYHSYYTRERQGLQDEIIDSILSNSTASADTCSRRAPWIVFTAGPMGAGKSWSIRHLSKKGYFPLDSFVTVDPDEIRRQLPEFSHFVEHYPHFAGEWTRKEAGFIAELLTLVALHQNRHVLVDGTLRNASWYATHFSELRLLYTRLQIAILHVTAPSSLILERAHERSKTTGRVVPLDMLQEAMEQVPLSIERLRNQVDHFFQVHNGHDIIELSTPDTWQDFMQAWTIENNNNNNTHC